jgi:hypothetical protein
VSLAARVQVRLFSSSDFALPVLEWQKWEPVAKTEVLATFKTHSLNA